jgi:hypothetical protein
MTRYLIDGRSLYCHIYRIDLADARALDDVE